MAEKEDPLHTEHTVSATEVAQGASVIKKVSDAGRLALPRFLPRIPGTGFAAVIAGTVEGKPVTLNSQFSAVQDAGLVTAMSFKALGWAGVARAVGLLGASGVSWPATILLWEAGQARPLTKDDRIGAERTMRTAIGQLQPTARDLLDVLPRGSPAWQRANRLASLSLQFDSEVKRSSVAELALNFATDVTAYAARKNDPVGWSVRERLSRRGLDPDRFAGVAKALWSYPHMHAASSIEFAGNLADFDSGLSRAMWELEAPRRNQAAAQAAALAEIGKRMFPAPDGAAIPAPAAEPAVPGSRWGGNFRKNAGRPRYGALRIDTTAPDGQAAPSPMPDDAAPPPPASPADPSGAAATGQTGAPPPGGPNPVSGPRRWPQLAAFGLGSTAP